MAEAFDLLRSMQRFMATSLGPDWEVRIDEEGGTANPPYCRIERATPMTVTGAAYQVENVLTLSIICYAGPASTPEIAQETAHRVEERLWRAFRRGGGTIEGPQDVYLTATTGGSLAPSLHTYTVTSAARRGESAPSETGAAQITTGGLSNAVTVRWKPVRAASGYLIYRDGFLLGNAPVQTTAYVDTGSSSLNVLHTVPQTSTALVGGPMRVPLYRYMDIGLDEGVHDATGREFYSFARVRDVSFQILPDPNDARQVAVVATARLAWMRTGDEWDGDDVLWARLRLHYE